MPRRPDLYLEQFVPLSFTIPSETADTTFEVYTAPADRSLAVDRVLFTPSVALAVSDVNYVILKVTDAAGTVMAQYSTKQTGGDGPLTLGSQIALTMTPANAKVAAGAKLKFFIDVTGAPTVPAGTLIAEGRLQ